MTEFTRGHALVVGISDYQYVSRLSDVVCTDAGDVFRTLSATYHCAYPPDQVQLLRNHGATAEAVRGGLRRLAAETEPEDTVVFFFSGHGMRLYDREEGRWKNYLVAVDGRSTPEPSGLIEGAELRDFLVQIPASRLLVIIDACFAAGAGDIKASSDSDATLRPGLDASFYERLGQGKGRVLIASSRADQPSYFAEGLRNSLFTHYLLEGLRGEAAAEGVRQVGVLDLFSYVSTKVPGHDERRQQPVLKSETENNFAVALVGAEPEARQKSEGKSKLPPPEDQESRQGDGSADRGSFVFNGNPIFGPGTTVQSNFGPTED